MVSLARASIADARLLWSWANEPSTREASFQSAPIPWGDHERWFGARLHDPNCRLLLGRVDGQPVGQIRFQLSGDTAEVHISVADAARGRGHGLALLMAVCESIRVEPSLTRVVAHVKPDNIPSLRLFRRGGFSTVGRVMVAGHEAEQLELRL